MTTALDIRRALECGKQSCACSRPNGTLTHCVSHDDADPSLSIRDGDTAVLLRCGRGCSREDIISALKKRGLWPERGEGERREWNEPTTVYRFTDDTGTLVGEKGRFEWVNRETGEVKKSFLWRLPGSPKWGGLDGKVMPLYNLADVIRRPGEPVWFVEGEKAAQSLTVRGLVAVCGYAGAGQRTWDDSLAYLDGREVILWPDNDAEGYSLMGRMLWRFRTARIIAPDLPEKADAHDYFEMGGRVEDLAGLAGVEVKRGEAPANVTYINRVSGARRPFAS